MTDKLGYEHKPRTWYKQLDPEQTDFQPETTEEKALEHLLPTADREVFKSHLERGKETNRPHEVIIQRIEEDSFYRAVYKREINDMNTADTTLQELKNSEYIVEVMQGTQGAGAHRKGNTEYAELPEEIQQIFKTHDEKQWYKETQR